MFGLGDWLKPEYCPTLIDPDGGHSGVVMQYDWSTAGRRSDGTRQYKSLQHMWTSWNEAYLQYTAPRLMVRYEDVLFNQEQTLRQICACVGGSMGARGLTVAGSSKVDTQLQWLWLLCDTFEQMVALQANHGSGSSDREQSIQRYDNATKRVTKCLRAGKVLDTGRTTICEPVVMTNEELEFINNDRDSRRLMDVFGYNTNYTEFL